MARVSQLFDVLNKITIDALIKPKCIGERELATQHLLNVMPNDLVLLDRGYPVWWLFNLILSMEVNFCARVSCTKWKIVRKFFRSGLSEKVVTVPAHSSSVVQCKQMGLDTTPLKLRLIRIENDGKVAVLITSLIDTQKYPIELFSDLYHKRWPVEEDYKIIRCRIELENFSGPGANGQRHSSYKAPIPNKFHPGTLKEQRRHRAFVIRHQTAGQTVDHRSANYFSKNR